MMLPDVRNDNMYNEDFLNEKDKEFLRGFDWAMEMVADSFFAGDMNGWADEETRLGHALCKKVPKRLRDEYTMEFYFGDRKPEKRKTKTYADILRLELLEHFESNRNDLVVAMLDKMDEDEYKKNRKEALKKNEKKPKNKRKEYRDTRSIYDMSKKKKERED